jgi:hypothetical protein
MFSKATAVTTRKLSLEISMQRFNQDAAFNIFPYLYSSTNIVTEMPKSFLFPAKILAFFKTCQPITLCFSFIYFKCYWPILILDSVFLSSFLMFSIVYIHLLHWFPFAFGLY